MSKYLKIILGVFLLGVVFFLFPELKGMSPHREEAPIINNDLTYKYYVINLDKDKERLDSIMRQAQNQDIDLIRVPAVNGYKILFRDVDTEEKFTGEDLKKKAAEFKYGHKYAVYGSGEGQLVHDYIYDLTSYAAERCGLMTAGEVGLIVTTVRLWKQILNDEPHIAVIFEDDAIIHHDFSRKFSEMMEHKPSKWDIIYLGFLGFKKKKKWRMRFLQDGNDYFMLLPPNKIWGAHSYMVNQDSAKLLLELHQNDFNYLNLDKFFSHLITNLLVNAYSTREELAYQGEFDSSIANMGRGY